MRPGSLSGAVVEAVFRRRIELLVAPSVIAEYHRVLLRPRQVARHQLGSEELRDYIAAFVRGAATEDPPTAPHTCPDPADQVLWDLLAARPEAVLVTGEGRLQQSDHFPGRVVSPREFVERYLAP